MKKYFFVLILFGTQCILFAQSKILPDFTSIFVSGNVIVELIKSTETKADYIITKGKEEDLVVEVTEQKLTVKIKAAGGMWNRSQTKARVKIFYKNLNSIDCSAGSNISASAEINTTQMQIDASSGSSCKVKVKCKQLKTESSSGSKISLSGDTVSSIYRASSGARIDASELIGSEVVAKASSGAKISLFASKKLQADASSGGSIKYKGNPEKKEISSNVSGGNISSF